MNFNQYIIGESDFGFYNSLPEDERILFLYDLICEDAYGAGSVPEINSPAFDVIDFDELIQEFSKKLSGIVQASLSNEMPVNVLFINSTIIIQSDDLTLLNESVRDLIIDGFLLKEFKMTKAAKKVFHVQKYCKMYNIIGQGNPLNMN